MKLKKVTPSNRDLVQKLTAAQLVKKFPAFYGPDVSLPCLQELATGQYSEPDQSIPHPQPYLQNIIFNIFLQTTSTSSKSSLPFGISNKVLYALLGVNV
jgi:hypothetical protein